MSGADIAQRGDTKLSSEELAVREQIRMIQDTEFVPRNYRGKPYEIYACVLTGKALGFDPLTSLRQIYMVDGKATLSAEAMVALARRAGHSISGESSEKSATVTGRRGDNADEFSVTYTLDDAKTAGLLAKTNWQKHPSDMLWARAVSRLCRRLFPDVLAGVSYTPEEARLSPEERASEATAELPLPPDPEDALTGDVVDDSFSPPAPQQGEEDDQEQRDLAPAAPTPTDVEALVEEASGAMALKVPEDVRRRMENE